MAVIEFTTDDIGKTVVDANGEEVGRIVDTQGGAAYVDPDPDVVDTIRSELGWSSADEEAQELVGRNVEEVTEDEVRLSPLEG